jgi:hypothetical protein
VWFESAGAARGERWGSRPSDRQANPHRLARQQGVLRATVRFVTRFFLGYSGAWGIRKTLSLGLAEAINTPSSWVGVAAPQHRRRKKNNSHDHLRTRCKHADEKPAAAEGGTRRDRRRGLFHDFWSSSLRHDAARTRFGPCRACSSSRSFNFWRIRSSFCSSGRRRLRTTRAGSLRTQKSHAS